MTQRRGKTVNILLVNPRRCFLLQVISIVALLHSAQGTYGAEYFCTSGDVTCLIASITNANTTTGENIITLEPGNYTLQAIDNDANGLPSIRRHVRIQSSADDTATVIERDIAAPIFRILHIATGGELVLNGVTIQRGGIFADGVPGSAIFNEGVTSLEDSIVANSGTYVGTILNRGTLNVLRSLLVDNRGGHDGGAINNSGGNVLVENSTIAHNHSIGAGGIFNVSGSLVVRNSAIVFNTTDNVQPGGGILNFNGSVEIVNSTIAKNLGGIVGGGISNSGFVSIKNSTIRENQSHLPGAGIFNGGILEIQNTIIAGNTLSDRFSPGPNECSGSITSLGNNLIGDPSGCDIIVQPNDLIGDPGLGALVQMGEDDQPGKAFYPVLPGSVVINGGNSAVCLATDQLGNSRLAGCDIGAVEFQERAQVSIDVRPRSDANKVNPHSTHSINVAILSENRFDALSVDSNTIRFGLTGIEATPVHIARRDVNRDGQRDLVLRFQIQDLEIECGTTSVTLTGQLVDGQAIIGSTPITTTGCKQKKPKKA
jgi:hypothetical protein